MPVKDIKEVNPKIRVKIRIYPNNSGDVLPEKEFTTTVGNMLEELDKIEPTKHVTAKYPKKVFGTDCWLWCKLTPI